jgi:hemerythrin
MAIQWTPDLKVGVEQIDDQHKELFRIIDELLEAMRLGRGKAEVARTLKFLETYAIEHFGLEERTMVAQRYPGYAGHKGEHEAFIRDFLELKKQHEENGATTGLVIEINNRVCAWLRNHIGRTDRALGAFLLSRPGGATMAR